MLNDTDPVAVTAWDGVHLWVDTYQPSASAGRRIDLRLRTSGSPEDSAQVLIGVALPAMVSPSWVESLSIEWRRSEDSPWKPMQEATIAPMISAVFDGDDGVAGIEVDHTLVSRVGGHVASWRVTSVVRPAPLRCLVVAESPTPRHLLREAGEAVVATATGSLRNVGPLDYPFQVVGRAESVVLTCLPKSGSLKVSVKRNRF